MFARKLAGVSIKANTHLLLLKKHKWHFNCFLTRAKEESQSRTKQDLDVTVRMPLHTSIATNGT